jgi:hypothetical protein
MRIETYQKEEEEMVSQDVFIRRLRDCAKKPLKYPRGVAKFVRAQFSWANKLGSPCSLSPTDFASTVYNEETKKFAVPVCRVSWVDQLFPDKFPGGTVSIEFEAGSRGISKKEAERIWRLLLEIEGWQTFLCELLTGKLYVPGDIPLWTQSFMPWKVPNIFTMMKNHQMRCLWSGDPVGIAPGSHVQFMRPRDQLVLGERLYDPAQDRWKTSLPAGRKKLKYKEG